MPLYQASFPTGSHVRIADREVLGEFRATWRYHNPLSPEQLEFAGQSAVVKKTGYYHGGDVLYELEGVPGLWHEQVLLQG